MKKNNDIYLRKLFFSIILISFSLLAFKVNVERGATKKNNSPQFISGDTYRFFINNIDLPLNKTGVIALVDAGSGLGGKYDGIIFLFSGGFLLSGYTNDSLWVNGVAASSRIEDYTAGSIIKWNGDITSAEADPKAQIYVLKSTDGDFAESWFEWKDAVELGAYYYDGDGNGIYEPIDLNANGKWDTNEDRPDLLGDETVWCVYNDGVEPTQRRFNDVKPQGIEIRQTVFGYHSEGTLNNIIFIRYSILNTGYVANILDSVYFSAFVDADIGNNTDDLSGSDTLKNAGFVYNENDDDLFGNNPPVFLIDFLQGPITYIPNETFIDVNNNGIYDDGETVLDTAYQINGIIRGKNIFPGAKNLSLSSFIHLTGYPVPYTDPEFNEIYELRNLMLGRTKFGTMFNPCSWPLGNVVDENCADINPVFMYSGDPVANIGWINKVSEDQRIMINTGPFKLEKGTPVDIFVAYVVGRGTDALNSITIAKKYDDEAQILFDNNLPLITDVDDNNPIINSFSLEQNYPNPFNPTTRIKYSIPEKDFVSIKIYDVLGKEVTSLINTIKDAGSYEVEFDAKNLASGIYLYTIRAGNFTSTKKMILLK